MIALHLILASRSPRRLDLLRGIGVEPRVVAVEIDEAQFAAESPRSMVLRLAEAKGRRAMSELDSAGAPVVVLAADTVVVVDRQVLGKPRDDEHARRMLRALSGREHDVLTGMFLHRSDDGRSARVVAVTRVYFRGLDETTIRDYVSSGEPRGKAGSYAIQGGGRNLVERIEGSWSNVVGLPLELLKSCLEDLDLDAEQLR